uniref:Uncharacterized protein n=1 Tax=Anguilla anguilla TaxID=7936 RepID=A0A0E9RKX5_ANGAN
MIYARIAKRADSVSYLLTK